MLYSFGMLTFHMSALRPRTKTRLPHHGKSKIVFLKRISEKKISNSAVILDEYSDLQDGFVIILAQCPSGER